MTALYSETTVVPAWKGKSVTQKNHGATEIIIISISKVKAVTMYNFAGALYNTKQKNQMV